MRRLEERYARELVVIGVHSAKFSTEKGTEEIRQAILRHQIEHPVVNDAHFQIWQAYTVHAWPTLVLIDPDGQVLGAHAGEITFEQFAPIIAQAIAGFDAQGRIDRRLLVFRPERLIQPDALLSFPGKVLADPAQGRLFIADTGHHRLLVVRLNHDGTQGEIEGQIGTGKATWYDGGFAAAAFHAPHGLALVGDVLYVADTGNHAIRAVRLSGHTVLTVAAPPKAPLRSPWDVLVQGDTLYIAMAGSHQLWAMDLRTNTLRPYAGTGREALIDGPLARCALNQPSGLATDGRRLYFADSEASAIRWADLDPDGQVGTIVGTGLFDFGDVDGRGDEVRLQHPLGLSYHEGLPPDTGGALIVADTYNHKIKRVDPQTRRAAPFLGTGEAGWRDGPGDQAQLHEPSGLSIAQGRLYIADTNNHLIRVADLETRQVTTLRLQGLEKTLPGRAAFLDRLIVLDRQTVAPGSGQVEISVELPPGHHLNPEMPASAAWAAEDPRVLAFREPEQSDVAPFSGLPITLPAHFEEGRTDLTIDLAVYYCRTGKEALCLVDMARLRLPIRVVSGAAGATVAVTHRVL